MDSASGEYDEDVGMKVQEDISKWQSDTDPLAPLTEEQMNLIYKTADFIQEHYYNHNEEKASNESTAVVAEESISMPSVIDTNGDYIKWMVNLEKEMKYDNLDVYTKYFQKITHQTKECEELFNKANETVETLEQLKLKYQQVTTKTDSLHNLSEQLTKQQKILKEKRQSIKQKLHHFVSYNVLFNTVNRYANFVNSKEYMDILDKIDSALEYLHNNQNYKESRIYKMKYESLLTIALLNVGVYINKIITEATKQVTDPESKSTLLEASVNEPSFEAFSLFYGKFQSAATKVQAIINHVQNKTELHSLYKNLIYDCQKTYFSQRFSIMSAAVSKALLELREKYRHDHSILFRSSGTFVMKVCQDEATCFHYFYNKPSDLLSNYIATLCQHLYDTLRPSLISINHLEILTELCGILRKEMLNEQVQSNPSLEKFYEIVKQLLQDVEERLVFRTNVFFQHDLSAYQPSPGDLAYPEKLEQMEIIAAELNDHHRADSRSSIASVESQEVAAINANQLGQFRSHTGNSPADLHGMWYPTVKRTLVCLSRLYFCLDRETFQGLAQEAIEICLKTVENAALQISARKTQIDGRLFQIKHLLIVREQIAPFQVDFTVKEMSLDFSNMKNAAFGLIHNRDKLFSFSSNNALLEFLLEGTPKVRQYLIDSRKEIDKQLKTSCEAFIAHCTQVLVGNMLTWIQKSEAFLKTPAEEQDITKVFREQENAKPSVLTGIISIAQRNIKSKIPDIQRFMQLYLANRETEFILFRPIKNNVINAFIQFEQVLVIAKYSTDDQLIIGCPSPEQVNILICSVALTAEQDSSLEYYNQMRKLSQSSSVKQEILEQPQQVEKQEDDGESAT